MGEWENGPVHDPQFTFNDSHVEVSSSVQARRARCVTWMSLLFTAVSLVLMACSLTMVWCEAHLKSGFYVDFYLWRKEAQSKRISYGKDAKNIRPLIAIAGVAMFMSFLSLIIFLLRLRSKPTVESTKHFEDQNGNVEVTSMSCCSWHSAGWRLSWYGFIHGYYLNMFLLLAGLSVFGVAIAWVHVSIKLADSYVLSSLSYTQAGFIVFCVSGAILGLLVSMESGFQTLLFQQAPYLRVIESTARDQQDKRNSQSGLRYRYGRDGSTIYGTMPEDFLRTYPQQPAVGRDPGYDNYSKFS